MSRKKRKQGPASDALRRIVCVMLILAVGVPWCTGCVRREGNSGPISGSSSAAESFVTESSATESSATESSATESSATESSASQASSPVPDTSQPDTSPSSLPEVVLTVEPGEYLITILSDLADLGFGDSVESLLAAIDDLDTEGLFFYAQVASDEEKTAQKTFKAEGYIAPETYRFAQDEPLSDVLRTLLGSWDSLLTDQLRQDLAQSEYSFDEILTMASIIEHESSFSEDESIKGLVASVVWNRLSSGTPLQMDTTYDYLQHGLSPYRDPSDYEDTYDTYQAQALPPGAIGSPSLEAVTAALEPPDTDYFFYIWDKEGHYYFASDYETHQKNVEKYLD